MRETAVPQSREDGTVTTYTLSDDLRTVTFEGQLIGDASNRDDGGHRLRWTEVRIYHSETGRLITEVVGRSLVFHLKNASCASGETAPYYAVAGEYVECERCRPDRAVEDAADDTQPCAIERDRVTIGDWMTWEEMTEGLKIRSRGRKTLSNVTVEALAQARVHVPSTVVQL